MSYRHENEGGAEEDVVDGDIPAQITELAQASVPDNVRGIRACKRCGILKTLEQFLSEGCENCPFLNMVRSLLVLKIHCFPSFAIRGIDPISN